MERDFWVYILAGKRNGTLYIGMTNDLSRRVHEHRNGQIAGFTARYGLKQRVWYEHYASAVDAIDQEKRMKRWRRRWKLELIERMNPDWRDLYEILNGASDAPLDISPLIHK
jgi:putative endonuclease